MFIALYDPEHDMMTFPTTSTRASAFDRGESTIGPGLTSIVIYIRQPLRLGTNEEQMAPGASVDGPDTPSRGWAYRSWPASASSA